MFSVQTVVVVQSDGRQCPTKPLGIPEVHSPVDPPSDGPEKTLLRFPHRNTFKMLSTMRRYPRVHRHFWVFGIETIVVDRSSPQRVKRNSDPYFFGLDLRKTV